MTIIAVVWHFWGQATIPVSYLSGVLIEVANISNTTIDSCTPLTVCKK